MPRKRAKKILKDVRITFYVSGKIPDAYLHIQRSYLQPTLQGLEKWVRSQMEDGIEVVISDSPFSQPKSEAVKAKIRAKALTPEARERSRQAAKKWHQEKGSIPQ